MGFRWSVEIVSFCGIRSYREFESIELIFKSKQFNIGCWLIDLSSFFGNNFQYQIQCKIYWTNIQFK